MESIQLVLKESKNTAGFLKFVLPSVFSMVFMALYTVVDGIFVSRFCGPDALAAINIVLPIFSLAGGLGIMAATGGSALVGIELGAGNRDKANRLFSMVTGSTAAASVALSAVAYLAFNPLLQFLGVTEKLLPYAEIYGMMIVVMLPVFIVKILLEFFMRVDGNPSLSLAMAVSGGVINMFLDWLFMAVFHMGIGGAALATAIGAVVSMGIGLIYFFKRSELKFVKVPWEMKPLLGVVVNGSSEMFTELSTGITTFLFNITALKLAGETGLAALSILLYTHFLLMSVFLGFSSGVAPLISYAHGAKDHDTMATLVKRARRYIAVASVAIVLFAFFRADLLTSIFVKADSPVHGITFEAIRIFAATFIFMGINIFASARYTALNQGVESAFVALMRALVGTLLGLAFLPGWLGLTGLWLVVPFAEALTFVAVLVLARVVGEKSVMESKSLESA